MIKTNRKTTTGFTFYKTKYGNVIKLFIDAVEVNGNIELWLYTSDMGIKMFCFGIPGSGLYSVDEAIGMLENQILEYADMYLQEYT